MGRVLQRDLKKMCSGLKKYIVVLDRKPAGASALVCRSRCRTTAVGSSASRSPRRRSRRSEFQGRPDHDQMHGRRVRLCRRRLISRRTIRMDAAAAEALPAAAQAIYEANYRDVLRRAGDGKRTLDHCLLRRRGCCRPTAMYQFDLDSQGGRRARLHGDAGASPAPRRSWTISRSFRPSSRSLANGLA
jgi:hypothetical protein